MKGVALPPDCTRNYTVIAGDTCDGISAKQNVSTLVPLPLVVDVKAEFCTQISVGHCERWNYQRRVLKPIYRAGRQW